MRLWLFQTATGFACRTLAASTVDKTEYNIKNLTQLLDKGERPIIGDLLLFKNDSRTLTVTGRSNSWFVDSVTEKVARKELLEIKELFLELVDTSPDFKKYSADMSVLFELCLDTGNAGVLICTLTGDKLVWADKSASR